MQRINESIGIPDRIGPPTQFPFRGKRALLFQAWFPFELITKRPVQMACTHHQPAQALDFPKHGQHVGILVSKPDFA